MNTIERAAKWGFILGVIMSISRIFEMTLIMNDDINSYTILAVEWIASIFVYFLITIFAIRGEVRKLNQIVNLSILTSLFAAVIVGAASHIYIVEFLGGYPQYIAQSISAMQSVMSEVQTMVQAQGVEGANIDETMKLFNQYAGNAESMIKEARLNRPTIFTSVFSLSTNYILSGALLGCVASIFRVKR